MLKESPLLNGIKTAALVLSIIGLDERALAENSAVSDSQLSIIESKGEHYRSRIYYLLKDSGALKNLSNTEGADGHDFDPKPPSQLQIPDKTPICQTNFVWNEQDTGQELKRDGRARLRCLGRQGFENMVGAYKNGDLIIKAGVVAGFLFVGGVAAAETDKVSTRINLGKLWKKFVNR